MQYLRVSRFTKHGAYLIDDDGKEVLLPTSYLNQNISLGSLVWVFVYHDSDDRLVAVTSTPVAFAGDIVALEIVDIVDNGIYLDIGIPKHIFMPSKNPHRFVKGGKVVVRISFDKQNRLIARCNVRDYLKPINPKSKLKSVSAIPFKRTEIGINCVVNSEYFGVIHNNDINRKIELGNVINAFVKRIRNDGKIDLYLPSDIISAKEIILNNMSDGILTLNFNSDSKEIFNLLGITKKTFKAASSALVKENRARFVKMDDGNFVLKKLAGYVE